MGRFKNSLRLLAAVPVLLLLTGINYYEDPANIFHDASPKIAEAILEGNSVYYGSANGDERSVKANIIQRMPDHVDCIVIGSSITMGISSELVGTDSFYNLAASGFNYNDIMATLAMLEINGVEYDRVILSADTYFFYPELADEIRKPEFMPYTEYMISRIEGEEPEVPQDEFNPDLMIRRFGNYFSVTYYQSCLEYIMSNGSLTLPTERWGIMTEDTQDLAHYNSDASWEYSAEYRANTVDFVYDESGWYMIDLVFARDTHIDPYHQEQFRLMMDYLTERGVEVDLFLCPLSPALWDRVQSESGHFFMLDEIESFEHEIAAEYGLDVIGSYNPYNVGISNEAYMDSRHIRHELLGEYFDFS